IVVTTTIFAAVAVATARATVFAAAAPLAAIVTAGIRIAAGMGVGVEVQNTSLGSHPLDPVVRTTIAANEGFGVGEPARMRGANLRQDAVQRLARESRRRKRQQHRKSEEKKPGTHGVF